jgi:hypothetical protein
MGPAMKLACPLAAAAVLLASPLALAQTSLPGLPPPQAPAAPEEGPPPAEAVAPEPAAGCRLVDRHGVDAGDAETATRLLCSEIVQAGAPTGARYRVAFGTLGSLIIVSVDREGDAPGSVADSRTMTLHGIEEIRIAAPRIADALVHGGPIAETQTVDNLVDEESRIPKSRPGKLQFGLGLAGALAPFSSGIGVAPAVVLDLHYGMSQIEIGGSLRFGGGSGSSSENPSPTGSLVSGSIGGRYYTSPKEISPYLGGGVAMSYFSLSLPNGFEGNNSGLGVYVDAGIEVLRTHRSHLALGARLDLPFFALNDQAGESSTVGPVASTQSTASSFYFAPLSVEARLTF